MEYNMPEAVIELTNLTLPTKIGTYAPGDTVPEAHVLDMTLSINASQALIESDGMMHVFDYDPLVAEIYRLASDGHYETQEWLISRIARACSGYTEITALVIGLHKHPVRDGSGTLGVRLRLNKNDLANLR